MTGTNGRLVHNEVTFDLCTGFTLECSTATLPEIKGAFFLGKPGIT